MLFRSLFLFSVQTSKTFGNSQILLMSMLLDSEPEQLATLVRYTYNHCNPTINPKFIKIMEFCFCCYSSLEEVVCVSTKTEH